MSRRWLFTFFLIFAGCQSNGPRDPAQISKATRQSGPPQSVELRAEVLTSPRPAQQFESAILLNPGIQACLREALRLKPKGFATELAGRLGVQGDVENFQAQAPTDALKSCLTGEFSRLNLGSGASGPFKMRISQVSAGDPASKTFLLDLSPSSKLQ